MYKNPTTDNFVFPRRDKFELDTKSRPSHKSFHLFCHQLRAGLFQKSTHISKSPLKYQIISPISEISSYSIKNPQTPPPSEWPYFTMSLSCKLAQRPKIWILKVNRVSGQLSRNNKWVAYEVTKKWRAYHYVKLLCTIHAFIWFPTNIKNL